MNDKALIEKLRSLGLNEYKASFILKKARIYGWSLHKTYLSQYRRLIFVYLFLLIYAVGFVSYLAVHDLEAALIALFVFSLIFFIAEFAGRFHKGLPKKIAIYFRLKRLPLPERYDAGTRHDGQS